MKNKNSLITTVFHIVEYVLDNITHRHVFKMVDAGNGVIFDSVPGKEDWVWGIRATGQRVEIPISNVLMVEQYDVHWRNNQGSGRDSRWNDKTVTNHLNNCPTDEHGVVQTPLTSIKTADGDTVYQAPRKSSELDEVESKPSKPGGQMSLF